MNLKNIGIEKVTITNNSNVGDISKLFLQNYCHGKDISKLANLIYEKSANLTYHMLKAVLHERGYFGLYHVCFFVAFIEVIYLR